MTLSLKQVEHIAELAKLSLTDAEKTRLRDQLSAILDYAALLEKLDTDAIPPTATVLPVDTVLREDEPRPATPAAQLLASAADQSESMFRVQVILE